MSDINKETLKNLCQLTRLNLTDGEVGKLAHDLKRVLDHIEQLEEVDVSDLTPYSHVDEQGYDALRSDEVKEPLKREIFLKNAPDQVGGMIRVPTVIKDV